LREGAAAMIFILEDNEDRIAQFEAAASLVAPNVPVRFRRSAHDLIADLVDGLEKTLVISLDHDLMAPPGEPKDPGTGYDVAKFLGELIPCCPIIIHTSNAERGIWMEGALAGAGWRYERVFPFGDRWIANEWARKLKKLLKEKWDPKL
jgi:hypothetical protein